MINQQDISSWYNYAEVFENRILELWNNFFETNTNHEPYKTSS